MPTQLISELPDSGILKFSKLLSQCQMNPEKQFSIFLEIQKEKEDLEVDLLN